MSPGGHLGKEVYYCGRSQMRGAHGMPYSSWFGAAGLGSMNSYDRKIEKSLVSNDRTHILTFSLTNTDVAFPINHA